MLARFSPTAPSPANAGVPILFRVGNYTEAPGSVVVFRCQGTINTPRGPDIPQKVVFASLQTSPNQLWTSSAQQAHEAADAAGFAVHSCLAIGKGSAFGLPTLSGSQDQATLHAMPSQELLRWLQPTELQQGYKCVGRAVFTCVSRVPAFPASQSIAAQEGFFVMRAQQLVQTFVQAFSPSQGRSAEYDQVGSLVKLGKL
ncbi:hypothetical protein G6011_08069 [Alternaria panax]|uniref:Uncharacterized protein n=1 Tax=Alternaria panax TaxID=48097 RepID=A0AAD4I635_9PLEO|nr:hypothetical protein G6011_11836 [Alternaria panax]KAG9187935.1 hypothetical protein G6011_01858 [Alternaria panax]KAG9189981.1 hypothetical protein G6011_08069 [Alternaria panax]